MSVYDTIDALFGQEEYIYFSTESSEEYSVEGFGFKTRQTYDSKEAVFKSENFKKAVKTAKEWVKKKGYKILSVAEWTKEFERECKEQGIKIQQNKESSITPRVFDGVTVIVYDMNFMPAANILDDTINGIPLVGWLRKRHDAEESFLKGSQKKLADKGMRLLAFDICAKYTSPNNVTKIFCKYIGKAFYKTS